MRTSFKENTGFFWAILPLVFAIFLFSNCTNKENSNFEKLTSDEGSKDSNESSSEV